MLAASIALVHGYVPRRVSDARQGPDGCTSCLKHIGEPFIDWRIRRRSGDQPALTHSRGRSPAFAPHRVT